MNLQMDNGDQWNIENFYDDAGEVLFPRENKTAKVRHNIYVIVDTFISYNVVFK